MNIIFYMMQYPPGDFTFFHRPRFRRGDSLFFFLLTILKIFPNIGFLKVYLYDFQLQHKPWLVCTIVHVHVCTCLYMYMYVRVYVRKCTYVVQNFKILDSIFPNFIVQESRFWGEVGMQQSLKVKRLQACISVFAYQGDGLARLRACFS